MVLNLTTLKLTAASAVHLGRPQHCRRNTGWFWRNLTIKFDTPGKYFVNLTVTDDDGRSSTATVLVEVNAKESEGLFGVTTTTAVGGILGVVIVVLLALILIRRRDPDTVVIETKNMEIM